MSGFGGRVTSVWEIGNFPTETSQGALNCELDGIMGRLSSGEAPEVP